MSKKRTKAAKQSKRLASRRWYLSAGAVLLIAGIAFGIATQQRRIRSIGKRSPSPRSLVQPPPPTLPDANHPSKEYIYGGGKLIATEAGKSDQTITFDSIADKTFGDAAFPIHATTSSGLSVSFTVTAGQVSLSGSTVTLNGAGNVSIRADQAGN